MRKRIQLIVCILLAVLSVASLFGVYHIDRLRRSELKQHKEQLSDLTGPDEWQQEHDMNWDDYFKSGGYFGDYGDDSATYPAKEVKGIHIQAEYATIHIMCSEELSEVEVFTQIGGDEDAISCELKEGILTIIQANLEEESSSDGSYIEVNLPSGKKLDSFELFQKDGQTSVAVDAAMKTCILHMDEGSFLSETLHGKEFVADINTANIHIKELAYEIGKLRLEEGVFRADSMDVKRRLDVYSRVGSVYATLLRGCNKYRVKAQPGEGDIHFGSTDFCGETKLEILHEEKKEPYLNLKTLYGQISLETAET